MDSLSLRVLGPVEATNSQGPAELGGPLQRSVLALLVAADGAVVPTSEIVTEVWGDADVDVQSSLRSYVSRLRRALDPGSTRGSSAIARVGHGYALRVPDDAVDARRFLSAITAAEAARSGGAPEQARTLLTGALAEWRGTPYADLDHGPRLHTSAAHLEEARRSATETLLGIRLDLGEHATLIGELEALVRSDPATSERAWALLATALYRAGRQHDALSALRRARTQLADRYGLDPTEDLRRLESAILNQDPGLLAPPVAVSSPTTPAEPAAAPEPPPLPLTTFVGRREEIARLTALLDRERLVTLVGSGGAGKTRLVIETLNRLFGPAPDDVCWAALGSVHDPALVAQTVADAIGVTTLASTASVDLLLPALRERSLLLVIDNCEHLTDTVAGLVHEVLQSCPGVRVLATSREELRVPGEVILDVRPLPVADDHGVPGEAVELFCGRAAQHVPAAALLGDGLPLVRRICEELDGVPLAIELAAARLRTLSLEQLLAALDDRFTVLVNGPRSGLAHHRALRETVAWSYDLLADAEREAFRRLAVFDGFELGAADAVLGSGAAALAHELAAKSLLVVDRRPEVPRWCMLETLRAYAAEVTAPEEARDTAERHLRWVEELTATAAPHLRGPDAAEWIARLDAEQANVRQALTWALEQAQAVSAARIAADLPWYWYRRGHTAEGRVWLEQALAPGLGDPVLRARLLHGVATLAYLDGDMPRVSAALEEAVGLVDDVPDVELRSRLYGHLGYFRAASGDLTGAREIAREGLTLAVEAELPAAEAEALMTLGQLARFYDVAEADRLLERAIAVATDHAETWVAVSSAWIAAKVALTTQRPAAAIRLSAGVVTAMAAQHDTTAALAGLQTLAGAVAAGGDGRLGGRLLGAVDAIGERIGYSPARMDPIDSPWIRQLVVDAGPAGGYEAAYAEGRLLTMTEAVELARSARSRGEAADSFHDHDRGGEREHPLQAAATRRAHGTDPGAGAEA